MIRNPSNTQPIGIWLYLLFIIKSFIQAKYLYAGIMQVFSCSLVSVYNN